jgi:hypothetical protein
MAVISGSAPAPAPDPARPDYTFDRRLSLTADGRVVEQDDPEGMTLLGSPGVTIPFAEALKYGLVDADTGQPTALGKKAAPATAPAAPESDEDDEEEDDGPDELDDEGKPKPRRRAAKPKGRHKAAGDK